MSNSEALRIAEWAKALNYSLPVKKQPRQPSRGRGKVATATVASEYDNSLAVNIAASSSSSPIKTTLAPAPAPTPPYVPIAASNSNSNSNSRLQRRASTPLRSASESSSDEHIFSINPPRSTAQKISNNNNDNNDDNNNNKIKSGGRGRGAIKLPVDNNNDEDDDDNIFTASLSKAQQKTVTGRKSTINKAKPASSAWRWSIRPSNANEIDGGEQNGVGGDDNNNNSNSRSNGDEVGNEEDENNDLFNIASTDYFSQNFNVLYKDDTRSRDDYWFWLFLTLSLGLLIYVSIVDDNAGGRFHDFTWTKILINEPYQDLEDNGVHNYNITPFSDNLYRLLYSTAICFGMLTLGRLFSPLIQKYLIALVFVFTPAALVYLVFFSYNNNNLQNATILPALVSIPCLMYSLSIWADIGNGRFFKKTIYDLSIATEVLAWGAKQLFHYYGLLVFNILAIAVFIWFVVFPLSSYGILLVSVVSNKKSDGSSNSIDSSDNISEFFSNCLKNPACYLLAVYIYLLVTYLLSYTSMICSRTVADCYYEDQVGTLKSANTIFRFTKGIATRSAWDFLKNFLFFSEYPFVNLKLTVAGVAPMNYHNATVKVLSFRNSNRNQNADALKYITTIVSQTLSFLFMDVYILLVWYFKKRDVTGGDSDSQFDSELHTCTAFIIFFICYLCCEQWRAASLAIMVLASEEENLYTPDYLANRSAKCEADLHNIETIDKMRNIINEQTCRLAPLRRVQGRAGDGTVDPSKSFLSLRRNYGGIY